ncbi:VOC family protein [Fulvivirga sp. M361]|uniref:VOC family protein n=1 Tax=Fulvivirga sp. M361 TaxID=2594266 RepID=UPI001179F07D|nr:VOC family protein [Fulvivirga sp. M361]TRX59208.1 VOC family protein [Fulvivirga sp. M361]
MLADFYTFNSFSTNDLDASRKFYGETLGLKVIENEMGILEIQAGGSNKFIIYPKGETHQPANFTVLNFEIKDIEKVVGRLISKGITFEQYPEPMKTDEKGIYWHSGDNKGPNIAWFKDTAGNILALIEEQ